jgi:lysophospholipase L1-like esterase
MTVSRLRVGFAMLGVLLLAVFTDPAYSVSRWLPLAFGPWLLGALLLYASRRGTRIASSIATCAKEPGVFYGCAVWLAVALLAAEVFSPSAASLILSWGISGILVLAAFASAERLAETVVGSGLVVVTVAFLLVGAELLFRTPTLQHRLGLLQERNRWSSEVYDGIWRDNLFSFRSRVEVVREPGKARILAVGDSFTWGDKIAATENTWPARLQASLDDTAPGAYQVVNMAQRGYTTANEAELLRRLGWQFDPDLIVLQFFQNDAFESRPNFESESSRNAHGPLLPARLRTGRVRNSAFLDALNLGRQRFQNRRGDPRGSWPALYEEGRTGWRQMQEALLEVGRESEARGVPVLFVIFPYFYPGPWSSESYPAADINRKVAAAAEAAGLSVLDLTPVFASDDGKSWWATAWDAHPNAAAHDLAAREILRSLTERGLIPDVESELGRSAP